MQLPKPVLEVLDDRDPFLQHVPVQVHERLHGVAQAFGGDPHLVLPLLSLGLVDTVLERQQIVQPDRDVMEGAFQGSRRALSSGGHCGPRPSSSAYLPTYLSVPVYPGPRRCRAGPRARSSSSSAFIATSEGWSSWASMKLFEERDLHIQVPGHTEVPGDGADRPVPFPHLHLVKALAEQHQGRPQPSGRYPHPMHELDVPLALDPLDLGDQRVKGGEQAFRSVRPVVLHIAVQQELLGLRIRHAIYPGA